MKKEILFYILLLPALILFIRPNLALAISGACSYHFGVNCSVYDSVTGSAICNDGTESSVSFSSIAECQQPTLPSCTVPTCSPDRIRERCTSAANASCGARGAQGSCIEITYCDQEVAACQAVVSAYDICTAERQGIQDVYNSQVQQETQRQQVTWQASVDTSCQGLNGTFSHYDSGYKKCLCNDGYTFADNQCETPEAMCLNKTGGNSTPSAPYLISGTANYEYRCFCARGYILNSSGKCEVIPTPEDSHTTISPQTDTTAIPTNIDTQNVAPPPAKATKPLFKKTVSNKIVSAKPKTIATSTKKNKPTPVISQTASSSAPIPAPEKSKATNALTRLINFFGF